MSRFAVPIVVSSLSERITLQCKNLSEYKKILTQDSNKCSKCERTFHFIKKLSELVGSSNLISTPLNAATCRVSNKDSPGIHTVL